jgi:hypothetical protein
MLNVVMTETVLFWPRLWAVITQPRDVVESALKVDTGDSF